MCSKGLVIVDIFFMQPFSLSILSFISTAAKIKVAV